MLFSILRKEQVFLSNSSLTIKRYKSIPLLFIAIAVTGIMVVLSLHMFNIQNIATIWIYIAVVTALFIFFSNHNINLPSNKLQISYSNLKKAKFRLCKFSRWIGGITGIYTVQMNFVDYNNQCWKVRSVLSQTQLLKIKIILVKKDVRVE